VNRTSQLTISRQCELLGLGRSTFYRTLQGPSQEELRLRELIDSCHLQWPFMGTRKIRDWLRSEHGLVVNRKRVRRIMRVMGIEARYPKPRLSMPGDGHKIYPYLLSDVEIVRSNQVWATDITYIPMPKGHAYLVAILDLYSRKVLAWELSNTLDASFCINALTDAIERYGAPEIFNTDQGSQFTSEAFTGVLAQNGVQISMDGKGRWVDNVFVERLWRSVKYEEVYLKAYETMTEATEQLSLYFEFYNQTRPHQSLGGKRPDDIYKKPELAVDEAAESSFPTAVANQPKLTADVTEEPKRSEGQTKSVDIRSERRLTKAA